LNEVLSNIDRQKIKIVPEYHDVIRRLYQPLAGKSADNCPIVPVRPASRRART
jgi:hypothetical protein